MSIFCLILKKMSMILYSMSKFSCLKSPRKFSFQNYLLVRFVTMVCENVASDYGGGDRDVLVCIQYDNSSHEP